MCEGMYVRIGSAELERGRIDTVASINGHNALAYLRSAYAMHGATERFQAALAEGSRFRIKQELRGAATRA